MLLHIYLRAQLDAFVLLQILFKMAEHPPECVVGTTYFKPGKRLAMKVAKTVLKRPTAEEKSSDKTKRPPVEGGNSHATIAGIS